MEVNAIKFVHSSLANFFYHLITSGVEEDIRKQKPVYILRGAVNWYNQFLTKDIIEIKRIKREYCMQPP